MVHLKNPERQAIRETRFQPPRRSILLRVSAFGRATAPFINVWTCNRREVWSGIELPRVAFRFVSANWINRSPRRAALPLHRVYNVNSRALCERVHAGRRGSAHILHMNAALRPQYITVRDVSCNLRTIMQMRSKLAHVFAPRDPKHRNGERRSEIVIRALTNGYYPWQ